MSDTDAAVLIYSPFPNSYSCFGSLVSACSSAWFFHCVFILVICILPNKTVCLRVRACACLICRSPICIPFCRARIFCCCCSRREVRALTCLSVSSKTTAFSRWPRVCRKHTQSAHLHLLYNTQSLSFSTLTVLSSQHYSINHNGNNNNNIIISKNCII